MADLTAGSRNSLPSSSFGLPGSRKYPMPDRSHAANAKARASEMYNKGALSSAEKAQIDRKADAKLGHPREHSLSKASASHLHAKGYISQEHKDAIHKHADRQLAKHKRDTDDYGSLAPKSAGHYMTTVNPQAAEDGDY